MFAIKYVIMFEHTNVQMFKCTFEQNNVITNVRNIVINSTITFVINKYRKRILFTLSFLVSSCLKRRSFLQNMRELPGGFRKYSAAFTPMFSYLVFYFYLCVRKM